MYFKIFECCIPVRGKNRSAICDIQREEIFFIPNALYDILAKYPLYSIRQIKQKFEKQFHELIDEYFEFLENKELIFFIRTKRELNNFPQLDITWENPLLITNSIIDVDMISRHNFKLIAEEFECLGVSALQIRFYNNPQLIDIESILECFFDSRLRSIEIVLSYNQELCYENLQEFCFKKPRITNIYIMSAPFDDMKIFYGKQVQFSTKPFRDKKNCGVINSNLFSINIETFTEAQKHNTCLNRKISIDTEGYIRNCPSMPEHYGNIKDTTLQEAMQHPDFKKYWFINKDQIEVCKDCEFRYICTDCRAYREDPENLLSKPLKCGYNPYTCEWEEWSTNPLKQKAIDYYGMREMVSKTEQFS